MNRDETIALFARGREAWNEWAGKLLAERERLEEVGRWCIERDHYGYLEPNNNETRNWMEAAMRSIFAALFFQAKLYLNAPLSRQVLFFAMLHSPAMFSLITPSFQGAHFLRA